MRTEWILIKVWRVTSYFTFTLLYLNLVENETVNQFERLLSVSYFKRNEFHEQFLKFSANSVWFVDIRNVCCAKIKCLMIDAKVLKKSFHLPERVYQELRQCFWESNSHFLSKKNKTKCFVWNEGIKYFYLKKFFDQCWFSTHKKSICKWQIIKLIFFRLFTSQHNERKNKQTNIQSPKGISKLDLIRIKKYVRLLYDYSFASLFSFP